MVSTAAGTRCGKGTLCAQPAFLVGLVESPEVAYGTLQSA
jgi:hypothetical protein